MKDITDYFSKINQEHSKHLIQLKQLFQEHLSDITTAMQISPTRDKIIIKIGTLNQLAYDMEYINNLLIQSVLRNKDVKDQFLNDFSQTNVTLPNFKFPGYAVPEIKKILNDLIDQSFKDILAVYKQTLSASVILRHNNST